jgi:hypothetical protein
VQGTCVNTQVVGTIQCIEWLILIDRAQPHLSPLWVGSNAHSPSTVDMRSRTSRPIIFATVIAHTMLRPVFSVYTPVRYAVYPWIATVIQG